MINEEKIKLMTKMAAFEEGKGKESISICEYYRSDYISLNFVKTLLVSIIIYCASLVLFAIFNMDTLIENLNVINWKLCIIIAVVLYAVLLIGLEVLTYVIASRKYKKAHRDVYSFQKELEHLIKIYERE